MNLKKMFVGAAAGALMLASTVVPAFAATTWTLNAPSAISFGCGGGTYDHMLDTVPQNSNGDFTGTGHYISDTSYTWTITGNITGDAITFHIVYTGSNGGYTLNGTGTIANDGSISGTVDNNCQTFSMPPGSATAVEVVNLPTTKDQCKKNGWMTFGVFKNQGDCVSYVATGGKNLPALQ